MDHYWIESEHRYPFIVRVDGAIAGCVLVRSGSPHRFGEFFIVRRHRRSGVGTIAARAIFHQFPGEWLVEEVPNNDGAVKFWRLAIPAEFEENVSESGTTQRFIAES